MKNMNYLVFIKQVPDTSTRFQIQEDEKSLNLASVKWVINPYDEFALEEAIIHSEKTGGQVTVCALGPERCKEALRAALAMNVHKGIHLESSQELDLITQVRVAYEMLREELKDIDVVFCGKQSVDWESSTFGPALAQALDWPHVSPVNHLEFKEKYWQTQRVLEGGQTEVLKVQSPFVVCVTKGINEPRYPNLPAIMRAKNKPIETRRVPEKENHLIIKQLSFPPPRPLVRMIEGSTQEQAQKLYQILKEKQLL